MKEKCPVCGSDVKIVGETTMHYEPVEKDYKYDSFEEWFNELYPPCGVPERALKGAFEAARETKEREGE